MALAGRLAAAIGSRSRNSVAKAAGISEGLLRSYLNEGTQPGGDKLVALASVLDVSLEWLATGQGSRQPRTVLDRHFMVGDQVAIPIYPVQLGAGLGRIVQQLEAEPEGHHTLPLATARQLTPQPSALVALRVRGQSMAPRIPDGHVAIVDTSRTLIRPRGGIYAVRVEDCLMLKHARWEGDRLVLSSENPDFPPQVIDPPEAERVQVLGYVPIAFPPATPIIVQD